MRPSAHDPRKAKLAELCDFGGPTREQAADCLDISRATAVHDWQSRGLGCSTPWPASNPKKSTPA